eukprot:TRINITY_DN64517_c0_g1_i1.p2 TRINITY_DN64517_c0_g1~~TRINITY_DN64517_c0_g1_i1.p2  ORF type:complete len:823 (-),score=490.96 TRINITY_DN64517_c0_g1_i1:636-3104(-)
MSSNFSLPEAGMTASRKSTSKVKNRAAAPVQVSAEQILREAWERKEVGGGVAEAPVQKIRDVEELEEYRLKKRKEFEDKLRMYRYQVSRWLKYAKWEEQQSEFDRARSIYERYIDVDYRNPAVWVAYAEMEMRHKFINLARNVWDRAVKLLPRVDNLWYKYVYMEQMLGNLAGARQVFERWMEWKPDRKAWMSYVKMEQRHGNMQRARRILERFVVAHNDLEAYLKFARWEERHGSPEQARGVYERALDELPTEEQEPKLFTQFARFEEQNKEFERARVIYKYALDHVPKSAVRELFDMYTRFEKKYGDRHGLEQVILAKRRFQYENELRQDAHDYDTWFDYIRLQEARLSEAARQHGIRRAAELAAKSASSADPSNAMAAATAASTSTIAAALASQQNDSNGTVVVIDERAKQDEEVAKSLAAVRDSYERAVSHVPPVAEKRLWKRYIYLWINFALFEELTARDVARTREVYRECLSLVPHEKFTFAKVWLMYAHFEVRQKRLGEARKMLGVALGKCGAKRKLYKGYIELERDLGCFGRCRKLYEKYLQALPSHGAAWVEFAKLEVGMKEVERARAIFELAVGQAELDAPEVVWKAYIDFEIAHEENERCRQLYARLLERTKHVRVWISHAEFEARVGEAERARKVFERADAFFREQSDEAAAVLAESPPASEEQHAAEETVTRIKEERAMLLESWRDFEANFGTQATLRDVTSKLPKRVKKKRLVHSADGVDSSWEEYFDFIFPDEEDKSSSLKILAMARQWKRQRKQQQQQGASSSVDAQQDDHDGSSSSSGSDSDSDSDSDGPGSSSSSSSSSSSDSE